MDEYEKHLMTKNNLNSYISPASVAELSERYAVGERTFPNTELSESDLSAIEAVTCAGAVLVEVSYAGATCYGVTLNDKDQFPST